MRIPRIIAVLSIFPLLAGSAAAQTDRPQEPAPLPSSGCGTPTTIAAADSATRVIAVGGLQRAYRLHVPAGYDPAVPMPLVLNIHGYTGTAENLERYSGVSDHADANGYLVVYPQSTGFTAPNGSSVTSWNDLAGSFSSGPAGPICTVAADDYPTPPECSDAGPCVWASCNDDLGFIHALLDELEANYCVDTRRVSAIGMSNGAMFVHRLACAMPERLAAIAPIAGTLARGFNCAPATATPVALLNLYGTQDRYVDLTGVVSSDGYYYTAADDVIELWAGEESQQCAAATTPLTTPRDGDLDLACVQRAACATGVEVANCTWNGGHDWPGDGVATDVIWDFFRRNPQR
jgi:polyhydroxybutyrate depolymerase